MTDYIMYGLYVSMYLLAGVLTTGLFLRLEKLEPHIMNFGLVILWPLLVAAWIGFRLIAACCRGFAVAVSLVAGHKGRYSTAMDDDYQGDSW